MTTTYDPFDPKYFDPSDLREEMDRVYDLCHGCRLCFKFCTSFPTMFDAIDRHDDQDSKKLTDDEVWQVVDECFQCKLCYINCPYVPGKHEWELDFPRLMLRADAVAHRERKSVGDRITDQALGRTDLIGKLNSALSPVVNKALAATGSVPRNLMEKAVGIASERVLPPYAKQRFSSWYKRREAEPVPDPQAEVALFSTCLVEYQAPEVGQAVVEVYEHNGVGCEVPEGQICCGAPFLHQGNVEQFRKQARRNIAILADQVRAGRDIVVPQPTCGYALKKDYPDYVGGADADLVAEHTYDTSEYLWKVHKGEDSQISTEFDGPVPQSITYHAPCHLRAQEIGLKSRDLMKLTGAKISVVAECSAIDGTWGYRKENIEISRKVASKMAAAIEKAGTDVIAGDCHLANGGIVQEVGAQPLHPMQIMARAYGLGDDTPQHEVPKED